MLTRRRFAVLLPVWCVLVFARPTAAQRNVVIPPLRADMVASTDWLADHMKDPQIVVLHVAASRADYDAGHIPGARYLPFDKICIERRGLKNEMPPVAALERLFAQLGVGDQSRVVLYGDRTGLSAARAYWTLDYLGHGDRAALLDGGLEKWRAEERPVVTVSPQIVRANFAAKVNPRVLATMQDVRRVAADHSAALLDARPSGEYTGETPVSTVARAGHIPGATNLYWQELIESNDNPELRPAPLMRQSFARAGATLDRKLIVYCNTGVQAAFEYFVAKFLGYDVSLYDGSLQEWAAAKGTHVEASGQPVNGPAGQRDK